jgi:hypothetical protein
MSAQPAEANVSLLAAAIALTLSAQVPPPDWYNRVQLRSYIDGKGVETTFEIPRPQAQKQSRWSPEQGLPPLDIAKAIAIARAAVIRHHPKASNLHVDEVCLFRVGDDELPDLWYYAFEFAPPFAPGHLKDGVYETFHEVVLLDGTLVEPHTGSGRSRASR